ncbi:MAG: hypothetical protein H0T97_14155 [Actinobacteria bacterium]|nr:hypothetical protein [Actinomycetota bacterium]
MRRLLLSFEAIRAATRRVDRVVAMRLATAVTAVGLALAATGLSPLAVVALFSGLLLGEAAVEMTRAPAA